MTSLPIDPQNAHSRAVILHYSGYGYARRGAPVWLVRFVERFRKLHANIPWLTMFHEVAASGPVHTSAFWTRPLQLWVAKRLRKVSDRVFTNCTMNANILCEAKPNTKEGIRIVPVFSNFGEPATLASVNDRHSQLVIFTSNFGRGNPTPEFWQCVAQTVALHHIERVVLIGRPVSLLPEVPFPIQQTGFLETEKVSELLGQSRFGYAFFGPLLLGKSGIFAAFAAHGVIPLIPVTDKTLPDGLIAGLHYLRLCDKSTTLETEKVQKGLFQWYRQHDLITTAAEYMNAADRLQNGSRLYL
ncbi:hypothetical protein [Prosthecobacter fluviatilis]|uniref:Uncharacterized protein n=1 Tax=Prosthecobacter fluviatilis TaxID=445931 RepID=A0ABW0KQJ1_9BACT